MDRLIEQAPYMAALLIVVFGFLRHQYRLAKLFTDAMGSLTKAVDALRETLR